MKTIYLKVEVKNDMDLPVKFIVFEGDNLFYRCAKISEIHLPTDDEVRAVFNPEIDYRQRIISAAKINGALWYKSQIENQ